MDDASGSVVGHRAMPVLGVKDVAASVAFFRDKLGFHLDGIWGPEGEPPSFAILDLDAITVALQRDDAATARSGPTAWVAYLYIEGVDAYHEALRAKGVTILEAPHETFYGIREMTIEDLDGHQLAFGQDLDPSAAGPGLSAAAVSTPGTA